VCICLTDMAQDAGKSFHEYGLLQTTKDYIHQLASQAGVPYYQYYQIINNEELWAPEPPSTALWQVVRPPIRWTGELALPEPALGTRGKHAVQIQDFLRSP
jgi:hypothetical protein